jgi:hypothetical protein
MVWSVFDGERITLWEGGTANGMRAAPDPDTLHLKRFKRLCPALHDAIVKFENNAETDSANRLARSLCQVLAPQRR